MNRQMWIFCGVHILSSEMMPRFNDIHLVIRNDDLFKSGRKISYENLLKDRRSIFSVAVCPKPKTFPIVILIFRAKPLCKMEYHYVSNTYTLLSMCIGAIQYCPEHW